MRRKKLLLAIAVSLTASLSVVVNPAFAEERAATERVLFSFDRADGSDPSSALIADAAGNLYGTTYWGGRKGTGCGENRCGTVFKLTHKDGSWIETVLHDFDKNSGDGALPLGSLVMDAEGSLYGTTTEGGGIVNRYCRAVCGIVFKLARDANGKWILTAIHRFQGSDGASPSSLVFGPDGALYGTAAFGGGLGLECGSLGCGVAFKLSRTKGSNGKWTETILHRFSGSPDDGAVPGTLTFDAKGNLYGTTVAGGLDEEGTAFELTPPYGNGDWKETLLHSFNGQDGYSPSSPLSFDATGNLYGTTNEGGAHDFGVVYRLSPAGNGSWKETTIHDFDFQDGANPSGPLIFRFHRSHLWHHQSRRHPRRLLWRMRNRL